MTTASAGPAAPPHSLLEDILGLATGMVLVSLGLHLLESVQAVTGGTAGLALLLSYAVGLPFGALYVGVNLPFFALAVAKKGWRFTLLSLTCVVGTALLVDVHARMLAADGLYPPYAVVAGNLLAGVGMLILFRHAASLGGFNVLALVLQERAGLRAGYVQMSLDIAVVVSALLVVGPMLVLLSAAGAVVLNIVIALNHRPGRYMGI